jgi:hypothetical protein
MNQKPKRPAAGPYRKAARLGGKSQRRGIYESFIAKETNLNVLRNSGLIKDLRNDPMFINIKKGIERRGVRGW